jgi:hypothetical protein
MTTASPQRNWAAVATTTIAISAALAALLTYLIFTMPSADPPGTFPIPARLAATWLMFTVLLAFVFAAAIWRMTRWNRGAASDVSPMKALIAVTAAIGIVGGGAAAVPLLRSVDASVILFGALALAVIVALLIVRPFGRGGSQPPDTGASA